MRVSERIIVIFQLAIFMLVCQTHLSSALKIFGGGEEEMNASTARNLRAEARYLFTKANKAMDNMFKAEQDDDVDKYAQYLEEMRSYDNKLTDVTTRYEQLRDYLEAKIWQGRVNIEGFNLLYEKGNWDSILDHLTFRVKH